ncbi:response regulator [Permianibacter sp. IMCC34836]|uniref:ATP-binding protein n=1 Tax=Permianibacter fluminis TaxID=2738515 RepID=UPI001557956B|nr:ATP-binding protein [Permianibacter fluminis]NQD35408.1 response regulator [Permianibacter fluminis]
MTQAATRRVRLQWQLFVRVAVLVLVLIPLFGYIRFQSMKSTYEQEFDQRMAGATEVLSVALREPLWEFDESQIAEAVKALSYLDELASVRVTDLSAARYEWWFDRRGNSKLLEQAEMPAQLDSGGVIERKFTIQTRGAELAAVSLRFNDSELRNLLSESLVSMVTLVGGFTLAVLLLMYILVERYVGRPLCDLQDALIDTGNVEALPKVVAELPPNELQALAQRYLEVFSELRTHQQHLTEMVDQRTHALSDTNQQLEAEILRRNSIEQELIAAREQAEQANEAKTYFLAHMSHELRTPLNGIIGYAQLLSHGTRDESEAREFVANINRCADHLLELINRILDLSKIEQGRMERLDAPFALIRLIDDVLTVVRPRAEAKGLQLLSIREPGLPLAVVGDSAKLKQVLINLLGNAVKFTERGQIELSVRYVQPGQLQFAVRDTGVGISERDQARIFEPFQQAGTTAQQWRQEGTGLGLSIARRLVEMLGGELKVESVPNQGSCFRFTVAMPISDAPVEDGVVATPLALLDSTPPSLLIVDDVAHNRDTLALQLRQIGFRVSTVESAEAALASIAAARPDLVFMDIRMPGMDGIECARRLRRDYPGLPVLAFTASVFDAQVNADIRDYFDGLVLKPVDLAQTCATIAKCLPVQYRYSHSAPTPVPELLSLSETLSASELAHLRAWLTAGALARIRDFGTELLDREPEQAKLGEQLQRYARAYDIDALRRLIG